MRHIIYKKKTLKIYSKYIIYIYIYTILFMQQIEVKKKIKIYSATYWNPLFIYAYDFIIK